MSDSNSLHSTSSSPPQPPPPTTTRTRRVREASSWPLYTFLFSILLPVIASILIYHVDDFDPAPFPYPDLMDKASVKSPRKNERMLIGSEFLGSGLLKAPEDLVYDDNLGVIYTGCEDGWIKRVTVNESANATLVDNWVNTGGRPLGLALGPSKELIVADAYKGLLKINYDASVEVLTEEAEGLKFKITDGVDVAKDGMIYFTDASYKYQLHEHLWDVLELKPNGRVLSYNPTSKETKVLLKQLYFPNGVAVSPDQNSIVFCETPLRRCTKYYIKGEKKGSVDDFISHMPGMPDNIHFDDEGRAWIGLGTEPTAFLNLALKYRVVRKMIVVVDKYVGVPLMMKNGGVLVVDSQGNPSEHYCDPGLSLITVGIKLGDHLYCGSFASSHVIRLNLNKYPALSTTTLY